MQQRPSQPPRFATRRRGPQPGAHAPPVMAPYRSSRSPPPSSTTFAPVRVLSLFPTRLTSNARSIKVERERPRIGDGEGAFTGASTGSGIAAIRLRSSGGRSSIRNTPAVVRVLSRFCGAGGVATTGGGAAATESAAAITKTAAQCPHRAFRPAGVSAGIFRDMPQ